MSVQNISAKSAARLFGYADPSAMYKALRFETVPDYERMAKMAEAVGSSVADLFALWRSEAGKAGRRVA